MPQLEANKPTAKSHIADGDAAPKTAGRMKVDASKAPLSADGPAPTAVSANVAEQLSGPALAEFSAPGQFRQSPFKKADTQGVRKAFETALARFETTSGTSKYTFDETVALVAESLGLQFLFSFPAEKFPFKCISAACVRCRNGDAQEFFYAYRKTESANIEIATKEMLDWEFLEFADAYVAVLEQLHDGLEERLERQIKRG